jgi:anaerobic selenocysteine-containing dehydrogenase
MKDALLSILGKWLNPSMDRRRFLKTSTALASAVAAGSALLRPRPARAGLYALRDPDPVETEEGVSILYSTCQMCHGRCGIMAKVKDGVLLKLDGNPYNPQNMDPDERVPYGIDPAATFNGKPVRLIRGRLCPRGQAGIQTLYNPYRLTTPVKRVGARGSGRWQPISWDQALDEIAARINELIPPAERSSVDIDPSVPALGKIANGLLVSPGRTVEGLLWERIFKSGFGTANWRLDHTSICEASHHIGGRMATTGGVAGGKHGFIADHPECKYAVIIGANPLEANFANVPLARAIVNMKAAGGKLVVVDPRFSNTASKADKWVPIRPGGDAAFAFGLARAMIAAGLHRKDYLQNANKAAANADLEPTYTDATWLVVTQGPNRGRLLSPQIANGSGSATNRYCWADGAAVELDPTSTTTPAEGELEPGEVTVGTNNVVCKTAFQLYREQVFARTLAEWSVLCGVPATDIQEIAMELANPAYGRRTAIWGYRGPVQHANGTLAWLAIEAVATLLGNFDYRGGMTAGAGGWDDAGGVVNLRSVPGGVSPTGPRIDRAGTAYGDVAGLAARDGYPAKRPWFPFAVLGNYQEVVPGIADQYPYPAKVLITYWNAFPYSVPALKRMFEATVSDETRLPLFVAIDPIIGENSAYADYILPDTTYLEKWAFPGGGNAAELVKAAPFQQPVVGKLDGVVIGSAPFNPSAPNAFESYLGPNGPRMVIDIVRDLAARLGLPGVGANAFEDGGDFNRAWDLVKRQVQNVAQNAGVSVTDIIRKGGVFQGFDQAYADFSGTPNPGGAYLKNRYGGARRLYVDALVTTRDWLADRPYFEIGVPQWEPPRHMNGAAVDDREMPLHLVTFKLVLHGQARTHVNPWLMLLRPENAVEISVSDARALGIVTGDLVRVRSKSHPGVLGRALVTEGLRPGVVAISHHYGHWEGGSRPQVVEGSSQFTADRYELWRGAGLTANPLMRTDDMLKDVTLQDRLGGSASFYDTRVTVEKVIDY